MRGRARRAWPVMQYLLLLLLLLLLTITTNHYHHYYYYYWIGLDWIARQQSTGKEALKPGPKRHPLPFSGRILRRRFRLTTPPQARRGERPEEGEGDPRTPPPLAVRARAAHERRRAPRPGGARGKGTGRGRGGRSLQRCDWSAGHRILREAPAGRPRASKKPPVTPGKSPGAALSRRDQRWS